MQAIIFDLDGTLVNNMQFHVEAWLTFLKKHGIVISPEDFDAQNHGTISEMMIRFFGNHLSLQQIHLFGEEKELTYRNLYTGHIQEIKGLTALLQNLQLHNYKIGLATMSDKNNIAHVLGCLQIKNYFTAITGVDEVLKGKPNGEVYVKTLEKLKVKKLNAIAVEDSKGGVQAAIHAGLKVIGITTTHTKEELLSYGCYKVIDNFENFTLLIK